jgi:transposase
MFPPANSRVYLAIGSTDMRKAINGLSILVEQHLCKDPFSGDLFVFCNRRRNMIKIFYWDKNGFCLWQKRLEEHRFQWQSPPRRWSGSARDSLNGCWTDWIIQVRISGYIIVKWPDFFRF